MVDQQLSTSPGTWWSPRHEESVFQDCVELGSGKRAGGQDPSGLSVIH